MTNKSKITNHKKQRFVWNLGFVILLFLASVPLWAQNSGDWSELKGDHFIVYYRAGERNFADQVLRQAERYYDRIAGSLGYSRRSEFWLWENRCRIYVHPNRESFQKVAQQAAWSSGFAIPEERTIVSFSEAAEFLDSVLPHELTHLIFRDFVGIQNEEIPLWLDEGLAMAQEEARRPFFDQWVKRMIANRNWIPVVDINPIRSMSGASTEQAAIFYAEAQSLVRFLLDAGEPARFVQFCRDLRDGKLLEEALRKNYPRRFDSIADFERAWVQSHA